MNRNDLSQILAEKLKVNPKVAEKLICSFGDAVTEALSEGDKIVYSNFGTFYTVHYPSKVILHPRLGAKKKMVMLPTNVVKWMPSGNIKEMVNSGKDIDSATTFGASKKLREIAPTTANTEGKIDDSGTAEDEEIEIPIRRIKTPSIPDPNEDKANFWDQLFKKESQESTSASSKIEVATTPDDTTSSSKVGTGIFETDKLTDKDDDTKITPNKNIDNNEAEESDLPPLVSRKNPISYIDLSKSTIPKEVLQIIPEKIARKYGIVPVEEKDTELIVGMIDPEDIEAIEIVKKAVGRQISPRLTNEMDLNHVLDQYQGFEDEVKEAINDVKSDETKSKDNSDKNDILTTSENAPASRIVSSLLKRAIRDKSSDIHIEPYEDEVVVRFRVDGILHKKVSLPKGIQQAVISRIKILSNLKIDEQRLPQDGRFSINIDNRRVDFRVSTMPIANGEKVVMRILDKLSGIISINDLGFRERDFNLIISACEKSHGMVLVTGPTGSGKTTTLYALIDKIYTEGINIITLEDPIEYQIPGINQSQVNAEINYTFASGLRSILRQDPDVVMIGEIRDQETAQMAVHAALTGHVVLSTLHTNDSAGAIPRLIDMQIEPFLMNSSLNMVIAQRLARKICDSCKYEITPSPDQLRVIKEEIEKLPKAERSKASGKLKFYKGKGCKDCSNTGYKGRIGLYEVLENTEKIRNLAANEASADEIKETAIKDGMTTMIQDGILKALNGMTTIEEVWRVTKE